jgi:spore germination protein YaaH
MEEVDLERLVLPALLALLVLGAFLIVVTNGGGGQPANPGLVVPKSDPASQSQSQTATPRHRFVKVQPGDTPASIAQAAGISPDRLLELNPSIDPSSLRPGATLKLAP